MSRSFNGAAHDYVQFGAGTGGLATKIGGPITIAVLWRASSQQNHWLIDAETSVPGRVWALNAYGGDNHVYMTFGTSFQSLDSWVSGRWYLTAITKPAGVSTIRAHTYDYTAGTWTHTDYPTIGDGVGTITAVRIGTTINGTPTDALNGNVAAAAVWSTALSDANFTGGMATSMAAWIALNPLAAWQFNQASVATSVSDLTAGQANQSSISGTTADGAIEPPGWSYYSAGSTVLPVGTALPLSAGSPKALVTVSVSPSGTGLSLSAGAPKVTLNYTVRPVGASLALNVGTNVKASGAISSVTNSSPTNAWNDWVPNWSVCDLVNVSPDVTGAALTAATETLWSLTGRRFGTAQLTIRPCRRDCSGMDWGILSGGYVLGGWWQYGTYPRPLFFNGVWYNLTCGNGCVDGACSCSYVSEAILPEPVTKVVSVKVDGITLDPSAYRVDDYRKLVRIDGKTWPLCNDLNKDDSQTSTWSVTVQFGEPVPQLGQIAVGELACQIAKALSGNNDCRLPKPVQQLVRQGVTLNFLDPNELFTHGKIGLYFCDLFISTVNPAGLVSRSEIFDIDYSPYRITNS